VPDLPLRRRLRRDERVRLDALRSVLRQLADTVSAGRPLSTRQLAAFNAIVGRAPVRARLELGPDGGYVVDFTPVAGDWLDRAERELAGSFSSMLRRQHPPRIKVCDGPDCDAVFYDESRSRTRRWCDSRRCGNRARVRRFRQRSDSP
jgi:predicted RNA-binding Zn ribbon-like protein